MFSQSLEHVMAGSVLGKTIYDHSDRPLLVAGTVLTERYLRSLRARGYSSIYIRDGLADDIVPEELISHHVRSTVAEHVATTFSHVTAIAAERGLGTGGIDGAIDQLGEQPLELGPAAVDGVQRLYLDVEALITELLEGDTIAGLESLKTHNDYTFQHSVDVAVIGVVLGKRLGMPHRRLRELALGCLLHDIGKLYIDEAILDKPGKLTREEFAVIEEHPRMGYELIRRMPVASLLPAHVAYQHHERQNGAGYPRGLIGDNRIAARTHHERIGAGRMLLIAEIGSVADVYSALAADRPYRPAMAADRIMDTLSTMRGGHLNSQLVDELQRMVPTYPIGHWIEVTAGRFAGWRGVVSHLYRGALTRPTVRFLLDAGGEALASPDDVDLRAHPDAEVVCLEPGELPLRVAALQA
jgi:HD-GYP domain-containing protein (c-di-GMP phosphodiesterase class II)